MELAIIIVSALIIVLGYKHFAKADPAPERCPKCESVVETTAHALAVKERKRWLTVFIIGQALVIIELFVRYVPGLHETADAIVPWLSGGASIGVLVDWWSDL